MCTYTPSREGVLARFGPIRFKLIQAPVIIGGDPTGNRGRRGEFRNEGM